MDKSSWEGGVEGKLLDADFLLSLHIFGKFWKKQLAKNHGLVKEK